jgi:hypothetical protein
MELRGYGAALPQPHLQIAPSFPIAGARSAFPGGKLSNKNPAFAAGFAMQGVSAEGSHQFDQAGMRSSTSCGSRST